MGYYTSYSISMHGDEEDIMGFTQDLLEISRNSDGSYDYDVRDLLTSGGVYAKLYEIDDWIGGVAAKYPNLLIILNGDGESSDDLWEERWKGTEHELQNAIIPPFKNQNLWTDDEKTNN